MKEQTLLFGHENGLIGTLTAPGSAPSGSLGVILLNAGMIHRVGPHRANVRFAHALAQRGFASIRFDLAGHGDSARPSGTRSFSEQAVADIHDAADALSAATGVRRLAVFGICSGAYHAFAAAMRDERLTALILFDAFRYPTRKTRLLHYAKGLREPHLFRRSIRLFAQSLGVGRVHRKDAARPSPAGEMERLGIIDVIPKKEVVGSGLRTLLDRGVKLYVIYSGSHIRDYNYTRQFHDTFSAFGVSDEVRVAFKPDIDHQFTARGGQLQVIREFADWIAGIS